MASPSGSDASRVSFAALAWGLIAWAVVACSSGRATSTGSADATTEEANVARDSATFDDDGTPLLTELAVSRSATKRDGSALVPSFSPTVYDYYVRCAEGGNALTVTMTAARGSRTILLQPATAPPMETQTVPLIVDENQAIVAAATNGEATTEYWVRCLPHDFPELQRTAHAEAGAPSPGYYLVGNYAPIPGTGCYAMVLDHNAVPVWYSLAEYGYLNDVDRVVSGTISFAHYTPGVEQSFEFHRLSPVTTTYVEPTNTVVDEHELRVLSNGHYLVISNPVLGGVDLTGVSVPLPDGGAEKLGPGSSIQDCDIVEFDPLTGHVVWTWTGSEHLDPVKDSTISRFSYDAVTGPDGGLVVDSFHCNAIDVDTNGNLLVSARHMDSVFYVDRATGAILWKMGGAAYTKDDASYVAVASPFRRQHDARLQPGWSSACAGGTGRISLFDDQTFEPALARAVVYDVIVGNADGGTAGCDGGASDAGEAGTAIVAWQHAGVVNSTGMGSFRILPDGSRTIGWGASAADAGAANPTFTEVDVNGEELLEVRFTDGNGSYRAIKVPRMALDLGAMRRAVGLR